MKQATANSQYHDNQECIGIYCGKAFEGVVRAKLCRPTPDYKNMIFVIDLDHTISVYGQERQSIEVWTNDSNTLYLK